MPLHPSGKRRCRGHRLLWLLPILSFAFPATADDAFIIYYSSNIPAERFAPYHLVVFDKDNHVPLRPLKEKGKQLLCYLSLGETESRHAYTDQLKQSGALLGENTHWKKSYMIDLRNPLWERMVIDTIIPSIQADGFAGVFLDTLDDPIELERADPARYKGMKQAAVDLVKAIRRAYPAMPIMMNRGYALLPQLADTITMELGESVYTNYNFATQTYDHVKKEDYASQVQALKEARKANPRLAIYTLDYWNKNDREGIAHIYKEERANGFTPYVSTVALDDVIHEPDAQ